MSASVVAILARLEAHLRLVAGLAEHIFFLDLAPGVVGPWDPPTVRYPGSHSRAPMIAPHPAIFRRLLAPFVIEPVISALAALAPRFAIRTSALVQRTIY